MALRLALLLLVSGCCTTDARIGLPTRPVLEPLDVELQADIPPHTLGIIARNQLKLKEYSLRLEARIKLHDSAKR